MTDKPNILVIMADQLAPQALSFYGNPVCKTPNLDRLAANSVVFDNAYCNYPLCVPSRASMMSGRLTPKIEVWDNAVNCHPGNRRWHITCGTWAIILCCREKCTLSAQISCMVLTSAQ